MGKYLSRPFPRLRHWPALAGRFGSGSNSTSLVPCFARNYSNYTPNEVPERLILTHTLLPSVFIIHHMLVISVLTLERVFKLVPLAATAKSASLKSFISL